MDWRAAQLQRLSGETFDLAVIGGGINGAAVARDAALHGLRVALVERADFAAYTSSQSSKLIHGGLRYLPQGQLRLVYQALRERERLRQLTAPHLVHPIGFMFPLYRDHAPSALALRAGLWLYDRMAGAPAAHRHRMIGAQQARALEPGLQPEGLAGAALFQDATGDDARLVVENILDAQAHGAAVLNYAEVDELGTPGAKLRPAGVRDLISGARLELRARVMVNATGPWSDTIRRRDQPVAAPLMRLTKGVHLIFPCPHDSPAVSLVLADGVGRLVFLMRYPASIVLGTTDTEFAGDPAQVTVTAAERDYLLEVVRRIAPGLDLRADAIVGSLAGVRALANRSGAPSALPREALISRSSSGLISIAGGKLTTHRWLGHEVVAMACRQLGRKCEPCPSLTLPLPGAWNAAAPAGGWDPRLYARYGGRAAMVHKLIDERADLGQPLVPGCPVLAAEAIFAARHEMVVMLEDFIVRRTAMAWRYPLYAAAAARAAAPLLAAELGWDHARTRAQIEAVIATLARQVQFEQPVATDARAANQERGHGR
ncbi:MAG TPA: glycerol-3-phosphate dehydrogenase/oxidase [Candidatus Binataceae bacterium]|nr:glycerol-3-phosphate dehydrogenase/oxidase [Candidatus Binataceae bacterium]